MISWKYIREKFLTTMSGRETIYHSIEYEVLHMIEILQYMLECFKILVEWSSICFCSALSRNALFILCYGNRYNVALVPIWRIGSSWRVLIILVTKENRLDLGIGLSLLWLFCNCFFLSGIWLVFVVVVV